MLDKDLVAVRLKDLEVAVLDTFCEEALSLGWGKIRVTVDNLRQSLQPLFGGGDEQSTPTVNTSHDPVNHPSHYTTHPSGVECIQITRHMGFNLGNAMKYLWRNGLKDGQPAVRDLEKAMWYIQDEINRLEKEASS